MPSSVLNIVQKGAEVYINRSNILAKEAEEANAGKTTRAPTSKSSFAEKLERSTTADSAALVKTKKKPEDVPVAKSKSPEQPDVPVPVLIDANTIDVTQSGENVEIPAPMALPSAEKSISKKRKRIITAVQANEADNLVESSALVPHDIAAQSTVDDEIPATIPLEANESPSTKKRSKKSKTVQEPQTDILENSGLAETGHNTIEHLAEHAGQAVENTDIPAQAGVETPETATPKKTKKRTKKPSSAQEHQSDIAGNVALIETSHNATESVVDQSIEHIEIPAQPIVEVINKATVKKTKKRTKITSNTEEPQTDVVENADSNQTSHNAPVAVVDQWVENIEIPAHPIVEIIDKATTTKTKKKKKSKNVREPVAEDAGLTETSIDSSESVDQAVTDQSIGNIEIPAGSTEKAAPKRTKKKSKKSKKSINAQELQTDIAENAGSNETGHDETEAVVDQAEQLVTGPNVESVQTDDVTSLSSSMRKKPMKGKNRNSRNRKRSAVVAA